MEQEQPKERTVVQPDPRKLRPAGILGSRGLLVVLSRGQFGRSHIVENGPVVVGRHESCDLAVDDPLMSRRHFRVSVERGEFTIEDLGSTNGTILNARRLERVERLLYGDRVLAGGTVIRFFVEEDVEKK
jgi:pSer/pThr/pTyr-binding forkhead associated (FHA) protein